MIQKNFLEQLVCINRRIFFSAAMIFPIGTILLFRKKREPALLIASLCEQNAQKKLPKAWGLAWIRYINIMIFSGTRADVP